MANIEIVDLGLIDYQEALLKQKEYFDLVSQDGTKAFLLLCQHNNVYTLGRYGHDNNLLVNDAFLSSINASYFHVDRGGDITYHGPGQLVAYPILNLNSFSLGVKHYVWTLEEAVIRLLSDYGISAGRSEGASGVWIGDSKVCAVGVKVSHFVTMHGLALNVNTDLSYFNYINPCGFTAKGVCSMASLLGLGEDLDFEVVKRGFVSWLVEGLSVLC